jgi:hypothetical protein
MNQKRVDRTIQMHFERACFLRMFDSQLVTCDGNSMEMFLNKKIV